MRGAQTSVFCLVALGACGGRALDGGPSPSPSPSPQTVTAPADGRCGLTPTKLVDASTYPVPMGAAKVGAGPLVVDGPDLYYVTYSLSPGIAMTYMAGSVQRIPAAGGAPTEVASGYVFSRPAFTSTSVILQRDNAYPNMNADDVVALPRAGGAPTTLVTFDVNETPISSPVTDGTFLYLATSDGPRAVPLAAPTNQMAVSAGPSGAGGGGGRADPPSAVLPVGGRLVMTFPQGDVRSAPLPPATGDAVTLATGLPPGPSDLTSCGTSACWLAGSRLERIAPSAGPATTVTDLSGSFVWAATFAFDGTRFYVVAESAFDAPPDTIVTVPAGGGAPVVLVRTREAGGLAVDDECLYWSSADGIFSVAKAAPGPFAQ
jgi:hypothetical protein